MSDQSALTTYLRERLTTIIDDVKDSTADHKDLIGAVDPAHRPGAVNLVRYVALRSHDAAKLQTGLASLGATSLATPEPAVLERLYAAHNVLDAFEGKPSTYGLDSLAGAYADADNLLEANTEALLGPTLDDTHSRIMVTLPSEAADDYELVLGFARAGMELARINCAHDGEEAWDKMAANVRRAEEEVGRRIRISCDLAGPKVRTGAIEPGPAVVRARVTRKDSGEVLAPATLLLHAGQLDDAAVATATAAVAHPAAKRPVVPLQVDAEWLVSLKAGDIISLSDTRGRGRTYAVEDIRHDGCVVARCDQNAYISTDTVLIANGQTTSVSGIPPLERRLRLVKGDTVILTTSQAPAVIQDEGPTTIGCTAPEAVAALEVSHNVLFDDGTIAAVVREVRTGNGSHAGMETEAVLEVTRAGVSGVNLAAYKGINLPDTVIPLPSLTEEDMEAFRWVAHNADIAAVSFIRTVEDVDFVLESLENIAAKAEEDGNAELAAKVRDLGIVLKIETIPAYEHLGSIMLAGMRHRKFGLMIARGDLAVELGFDRMVQVPGRIMKLAEAAHVPVIMATQILENLAKTGLPSRAEITDAGYALRSECVMLNKGPHITEAIEILDTLSRKLGRSRLKNRQVLRKVRSWEEDLAQ